jgi:hypothetical protein
LRVSVIEKYVNTIKLGRVPFVVNEPGCTVVFVVKWTSILHIAVWIVNELERSTTNRSVVSPITLKHPLLAMSDKDEKGAALNDMLNKLNNAIVALGAKIDKGNEEKAAMAASLAELGEKVEELVPKKKKAQLTAAWMKDVPEKIRDSAGAEPTTFAVGTDLRDEIVVTSLTIQV